MALSPHSITYGLYQCRFSLLFLWDRLTKSRQCFFYRHHRERLAKLFVQIYLAQIFSFHSTNVELLLSLRTFSTWWRSITGGISEKTHLTSMFIYFAQVFSIWKTLRYRAWLQAPAVQTEPCQLPTCLNGWSRHFSEIHTGDSSLLSLALSYCFEIFNKGCPVFSCWDGSECPPSEPRGSCSRRSCWCFSIQLSSPVTQQRLEWKWEDWVF